MTIIILADYFSVFTCFIFASKMGQYLEVTYSLCRFMNVFRALVRHDRYIQRYFKIGGSYVFYHTKYIGIILYNWFTILKGQDNSGVSCIFRTLFQSLS